MILAERAECNTAERSRRARHKILSGTVRAVDISTGERVVFVRGVGYFTGDIDLFSASILRKHGAHPDLF
jgi:hypothetical protein